MFAIHVTVCAIYVIVCAIFVTVYAIRARDTAAIYVTDMSIRAPQIRPKIDEPLNHREPPTIPEAQVVHDWWASLSDADKQSITEKHPARIGALDGLPAAARDEVNRNILSRYISQLEKHIDDVKSVGKAAHKRHLKKIERTHKALIQLHGILHAPGNAAQPRKYLLQLAIGPQFQDRSFIVAHGNPDTATHIATHVLGMGKRLNPEYDPDTLERSDNLYATMARRHTNVSVITYAYPAPENPLQAIGTQKARAAEATLARFQESLLATSKHDQPLRTLMGVSYGSGLAVRVAKRSCVSDRLVAVCSPGVPARHVSELHVPEIFALTFPLDNIRISANIRPIHGLDPTKPGFGAHVLTCTTPREPADKTIHDRYLVSSPSVDMLAEVALGSPVNELKAQGFLP